MLGGFESLEVWDSSVGDTKLLKLSLRFFANSCVIDMSLKTLRPNQGVPSTPVSCSLEYPEATPPSISKYNSELLAISKKLSEDAGVKRVESV